MRLREVLIVVGLCATGTATAWAADYWVAPIGQDKPGRGSKAAPFLTIQHAANLVKPGDTVHVVDGEYVGFHVDHGGTSKARVTFIAEGDAVKITHRNKATRDGINVENVSFVTIDGFVVNEMGRAGVRGAHADGIWIRRVRADKNTVWGIFISHSNDAVIEYNIVAHSRKEHGIYVSNSGDRPIVRGNVSFGNKDCGIHMNGDLTQGGDGIITGAIVDSNLIYGNGVGGGSAINADGVEKSKFINNMIYGNMARGISLFRQNAGGPSKENLVAYNTVVMLVGSRSAINIKQGATGNVVVNNILLHAAPARVAVNTTEDSLKDFVSDYNVIYGKFTATDGDRLLTLADWRSTYNLDAHSIEAKPETLFVAPEKADFRLRPAAPAIEFGDPTHRIKFDRDHRLRATGSRPTVGAYEYGAKPE